MMMMLPEPETTIQTSTARVSFPGSRKIAAGVDPLWNQTLSTEGVVSSFRAAATEPAALYCFEAEACKIAAAIVWAAPHRTAGLSIDGLRLKGLLATARASFAKVQETSGFA
ncbi:hypothetical protein AVEN_197795-1 [Araneus ventricosus]|uniref:Uncharacterized protein n=1 Tax=Araneus ventricosus TaxID=182803 RepID=A0A4Y2HN97_ARAVE|nr:hypothetical protein AVEN_197795-1 [Araneus ventricosus]